MTENKSNTKTWIICGVAVVILFIVTNIGYIFDFASHMAPTAPMLAKPAQSQVDPPSQVAPTPTELAQNPMRQARENLANALDAKLNDDGFDVTVTAFTDTLNLHGDIFTDTATRAQILQTIRSMPDFCAVGFRKVSMGAGVFSSSDYSLHC